MVFRLQRQARDHTSLCLAFTCAVAGNRCCDSPDATEPSQSELVNALLGRIDSSNAAWRNSKLARARLNPSAANAQAEFHADTPNSLNRRSTEEVATQTHEHDDTCPMEPLRSTTFHLCSCVGYADWIFQLRTSLAPTAALTSDSSFCMWPRRYQKVVISAAELHGSAHLIHG